VDSLFADIKRGKNIAGVVILDFHCLDCEKKTDGKIKASGIHGMNCPWGYYIECPHCHYESNLAKVVSADCRCRPK